PDQCSIEQVEFMNCFGICPAHGLERFQLSLQVTYVGDIVDIVPDSIRPQRGRIWPAEAGPIGGFWMIGAFILGIYLSLVLAEIGLPRLFSGCKVLLDGFVVRRVLPGMRRTIAGGELRAAALAPSPVPPCRAQGHAAAQARG